jgi:NADH dehydrogenase
VPSVASGQLPGLADLGIEPTPMEAVVPAALVDAGPTRFDGWRAGSGGG